MSKTVFLICKSNKMHLFSSLFVFFNVVLFTLKLTLPVSTLKVDVPSVLFKENNKETTVVNYCSFCTLPCILIAEIRRSQTKREEQKLTMHALRKKEKKYMFCCIISFIHHGS